MDILTIITVVTVVVTFILGIVSKKSKYVSNHMIPIQNLAIGIIASIIEYAITKDFNTSIMVVGLTTGGMYDIGTNINKLLVNSKLDNEAVVTMELEEESEE